jgi:hypothetical protein
MTEPVGIQMKNPQWKDKEDIKEKKGEIK